MNTQRIVSLLVLILIAVLPTGCLQSPSETGTGMTPLPTQDEAVSDPDQAASDTMTLVMFVENARKYAIKEGERNPLQHSMIRKVRLFQVNYTFLRMISTEQSLPSHSSLN